MAAEHQYFVIYDIACQKRWRQIYRLMQGYGEWVQLSVFQCRLTKAQSIQLREELRQAMLMGEDHVMMIDVGPAESVNPKVFNMGKRTFEAITRQALIV